MKQHASSSKANRETETALQHDTFAIAKATALVPPNYGIDFVDRQVGAEAGGPVAAIPAVQCKRSPLPAAGDGSSAPGSSGHRTALPDGLRSGVEALSGVDMSGVRVHAGSARPARLNALAFTQGNDIYLGPGHDRHLPHEAWHVVQQRQGRVHPTLQAKGVAINDDPGLEKEADLMGTKAAAQQAPAINLLDPIDSTTQLASAGGRYVPPGTPPAQPSPSQHDLPQPQVTPGLHCPDQCVQRAIGLEFEVKDWHVQHANDQSKLTKGTELVIEQDGVNLTADDDGKRSDIEWVTTALETRDEVLYVIDQARDLALAMQKRKDEDPLPASGFSDYGNAHPNAEFRPGVSMNASMQATIGVPLGNMLALYKALANTEGQAAEKADTTLKRAARVGLVKYDKTTLSEAKPPVPVDQMSDALKGFLLVVIDYLRTGFSGDTDKPAHEQFPKGNLNLLAKTSFKKMFDLVRHEAGLTDNDSSDIGLVMRDDWIDWIIQAAIPLATSENVADKKQRRVLDLEYGITNLEEGRDETPYTVEVTRKDWLREMPREDMLRHDNPALGIREVGSDVTKPLSDKMEGFAALGTKTDKLVADVAKTMAEQMVTTTMANEQPESGGEGAESISGESEKPLLLSRSKAKTPDESIRKSQTEAPVFEMRHLSSKGGDPASWPANAMAAWDIYQKAIGDQVYRAGNRKELEKMPKAYGDIRTPELIPAPSSQPPQPSSQPPQPSPQPLPAPPQPRKSKVKEKLKAVWKAFGQTAAAISAAVDFGRLPIRKED